MQKRILLLDDNQDILDIMQEALSYQEYQVKVALDSNNMINLILDYQPDLIILDYHLTGRNGHILSLGIYLLLSVQLMLIKTRIYLPGAAMM